MIEWNDVFPKDDDVTKDFVVNCNHGSVDFKKFVTFVLNSVFDGSLTDEGILNHEWLQNKDKDYALH